jgi:uncharacterized protein YkwD
MTAFVADLGHRERGVFVSAFRLRRAVAAAALLGSLATPAAAQACRGADQPVSRSDLASVRTSTICLLNAERHRYGLRSLASNRKLARVAAAHSRSMVRRRYFTHGAFSARVLSTGYVRGYSSWLIGENIAWGGGPRSTPRAIMSMWMHSPGHRANILSASYRHVGVGIAIGTPAGEPGGTYTTDFGRRS